MAEFVMPSLGAGMVAGILATWRKKAGDHVRRGEIIAEVETEKGLIEVEAFADGEVQELLVEEGTKVPVGTVLARISDTDSERDSETEREPEPEPGPETRPSSEPSGEVSARPHSTPAARRLAHEVGIDPERLQGTGPHGTVTKKDVLRASRPPEEAPHGPRGPRGPRASPYARRLAEERGVDWRTLTPSADGVVHGADVLRAEGEPATEVDGMRRAIAAAMSRSSREIPHYIVAETIDLGPALDFVERENQTRGVHDRLLPGVLFLFATIRASVEHPRFNGFHRDGAFVPSEGVHLGVAVSLKKRGLVAPAILDAQELSLDALMRAFRDVVTRAKKGQLRGREVSEPTLTVTSLGERSVEEVQPLIVPPQVAMVGFGGIVERPWVVNGEVVPRPTVRCTLAADHRVTDGHDGSRFVSEIARILTNPEELSSHA